MEHFKLLVDLAAVVAAAIATTAVLSTHRNFPRRVAPWFALSLAGIGLVALEILVFRYGALVAALSSPAETDAFRFCWMVLAIASGMCLALGLPRAALAFAGIRAEGRQVGPGWPGLYLPWIAAGLILAAGLVELSGVAGDWAIRVMQAVIFGSALVAVLILLVVRPGWKDRQTGVRNRIQLFRLVQSQAA